MQRFVRCQGLRYLFAIISLICFVNSTQATTVILPADDDLIVGARAIVRGRVLAVASSLDQQKDRIFTYVTLRVQEVFKGEITSRRIVLKEFGGTVGDRTDFLFGNPQFKVGEKVLVYLDTWADGSFRTHELFLGKFNIIRDAASGKEFAVRSSPDKNTEILQSQLHAQHAHGPSTNKMLLADYREMVRARLAANWERSVNFEAQYYRNVPMLAEPYEFESLSTRRALQPQFTLLGNFRFFEPDDGQPVVLRTNPSGAPDSQTASDMAGVAAAWTGVTGSNFQMSIGSQLGSCYDEVSFAGIGIVFNNCDERHSASGGCGSILAWGGGSSVGFRTRVIDGVTFRQLTKGFVSLNPFASCHFTQRCNVQEVVVHEVGHAIGLGHSQDGSATMAPFAHFDGRCASIRTDDQNGLRFIYPSSGGGGGGGGGNPLSITTGSLPNGTVGISYSQTLAASGGTPPYSWNLASGSQPLPTGLSLSSNGTISGTPSTASTFTFTVRVGDSASGSAQKTFAITINSGANAFNSQFVSQTVPTTLTPGQSFNATLRWRNTGTQTWNGSGGFRLGSQNPQDNRTWGGNAVQLSGFSIPPGNDAIVTFTAFAPTTPGTYNFQWQTVQDGIGFFGEPSQNVAIVVGQAPGNPTIGGPGSFDVSIGTQVSQLFTATGGTSPYTWSVATGSLPGGITLNPTTGLLSGTTTATGNFAFTIQVRDSGQRTGQKAITFNVTPPPPEINQSSLSEATMGLPYTQALSATGGAQPYTWTIGPGTLPTGLSLFAGVISGTPLVAGNFSFTVKVTDSQARSSQKTFSINVKQPGSISVQADSPVEALKGSAFSYAPIASGGTGSYNWSVTAGALPAGLALNSSTGRIAGTPTVSGNFNAEITVRDQASQTAKANLQIKVTDPATVPLITKIKYKRNKKTVIIGQRFHRDAVLVMDGVQSSARVNVDRFVIKKLILSPGQHQFRIVNPNNTVSPIFTLTVD